MSDELMDDLDRMLKVASKAYWRDMSNAQLLVGPEIAEKLREAGVHETRFRIVHSWLNDFNEKHWTLSDKPSRFFEWTLWALTILAGVCGTVLLCSGVVR